MRRYLVIFFVFLLLFLAAIGFVGTSVLSGALQLHNTAVLTEKTQILQNLFREFYRESEGNEKIESALEEAATVVDELRGNIALVSIRKNYFRGAALFLAVVLLSTTLSGVLFWLGMTRLFILPLEGIVGAMNQIGRGDFSIDIHYSHAPEIKFVQEEVVRLAGEVKRSQEKIKEMERQNIGRYFIHQIRNSITPIKLCTDVLKEEKMTNNPVDQKRQESLHIITNETVKIENLLTRFRSLYAFPEPMMTDVEVGGLVGNVLEKYDNVSFTGPGAKIYIRGDKNLLEQAVGNIMDNAVEADPVGVDVSVFREERGAAIEVRDNGPGIPSAIQQQLFHDFVTTKRHGMGIGLSFVKKVLDLHRFSIEVDSKPGSGTTIRIRCYE